MRRVEPRVSEIVERAFRQYEDEVNEAPLKQNTKVTYISYADKFVRWMRGDFEPGVLAKRRYVQARLRARQGGRSVTILHRGDLDGLVNPGLVVCGSPPRGDRGWEGGLAHEIGHALYLEHPAGCDYGLDHCDTGALMWHGYYWDYPETYFTEEDKTILETSPFINHRLDTE